MKKNYLNIYSNLIKLTRNKNLYLSLKNNDTFSDRLVILLLNFCFFLKNYKSQISKKEAQEMLPKVTAMLDKLIKTNIMHKNKAANLKSKLTKHVNSLS